MVRDHRARRWTAAVFLGAAAVLAPWTALASVDGVSIAGIGVGVELPPTPLPPLPAPVVEVPPLPSLPPSVPLPALPQLPPVLGTDPGPTGSSSGAPAATVGPSGTPQPSSTTPAVPGSPTLSPGVGTTSGVSPRGPSDSNAVIDHSAGALANEALGTAGRFRLPLGIAGIVLAFLFVQGRVDRREPKLAAAPIRDELYRFG